MTEKSKPARSYNPKDQQGLFEDGDWKALFNKVQIKKGGRIVCNIKLLKSGELVGSSRVYLDTANSRNQLVKGLQKEGLESAKAFLTRLQIWLEAELTKQKKVEQQKSKETPNKKTDPSYELMFLSENEYVSWRRTPHEARLVHTRIGEDGKTRVDSDRLVLIRPPRPKRRLIIDEETLFEVEDEGEVVTMTATALHQRLKDRGRITYGSHSMDVLSLILSSMTKETYEGHATYGVYQEGAKLVICESPHPMKPEQMKVQREIEKLIPYVPTHDDLQAYVDFLRFYHPHEILHKYGKGFTSPYTPVIRGAGILKPAEMSDGPPDTGKSKGSEAVSLKAYGIRPIAGTSINSEFRWLAYVDSCCLPRTVNEAEKTKPEVWPLYKDAMESWHAGGRGTKDLSIRDYNARADLLHTCNNSPLTGQEENLKRFQSTRFEEQDRLKRASRSKAFKEAFHKLRPIGFQLQRWWVEAHPDADELLTTIYEYERLISDEYEKLGHTWMSPQRAQGWASDYLGLKIFEHGCTKVDVDWHAPTIRWFVEKVVAVIEEMTWSRSRTNVSLFASWLTMFLAKNRRPFRTMEGAVDYDIVGKDVFWCDGEVTVEGRGTLKGKWVAREMVDQYNKENPKGHQYYLIDLGKEAADQAGVPYVTILKMDESRKTWVTKTVRMGDTAPKAAFVPDSLDEGWQIQTKPDQFKEDDSDEWKGLVGQDVTQCDQMLPTKVTEERDHLDSSQSVVCDLVTSDSHAYAGEKNIAGGDKECKKDTDAEIIFSPIRGSQKIGFLGHIDTFSTDWPPVTISGHNGSPKVTKQPEKPKESPEMRTSVPAQPQNNSTLSEEEQVKIAKEDADLRARLAGIGEKYKDGEVLEYLIKELVKAKAAGDRLPPFLLRQIGQVQFKDRPDVVVDIIDRGFAELDAIAERIHKVKKRKASMPKELPP